MGKIVEKVGSNIGVKEKRHRVGERNCEKVSEVVF